MADADYNDGNYTKQPEKGWRAWVDVLLTLATRTPDGAHGPFGATSPTCKPYYPVTAADYFCPELGRANSDATLESRAKGFSVMRAAQQ